MPTLMIQFIADDRLLIYGTGEVSTKGGVLEIGPGSVGEKFPYHSPQAQKEMFGHQAYVLIDAQDDEGEELDHPDLNKFLDGNGFIDPAFVRNYPEGAHPAMLKRGAPGFRGLTSSEVAKPKAKKSKKTKLRVKA